jgi:hypothetical protein
MTDVDVHVNIAMTPRLFGGALFLFLLAAVPSELASEAVTLNSYYPAPSGIYTQMITTGNTYLARDSGYVGVGVNGSIAGVGTITAPTNTTGVNSTKLIVLGGNFGVGTVAPTAAVQITDPRNAPVAVAVNGQILTGDGSNFGRVYFGPVANNQWVGTSGGSGSIVTMTNGSASIIVDNTGRVGIGVTPVGRLDVNGVVVGRSTNLVFSLP